MKHFVSEHCIANIKVDVRSVSMCSFRSTTKLKGIFTTYSTTIRHFGVAYDRSIRLTMLRTGKSLDDIIRPKKTASTKHGSPSDKVLSVMFTQHKYNNY